MRTFMKIMLVLAIIGAINWLLIGIADFNLVSSLFGSNSFLTNLIYIIVGIAGLCSIYFFFDEKKEV